MSMQEYEHQVRTTGFCVLPGVIPDDAIPGIRASILKTTEEVGQQSYFAPSATVAIAGLINYDQSFVSYLVECRLSQLVTSLLDEHYRVSFTTALVNHPSQERGQWHADWPFIQSLGARVVQPYPDAIIHLTCLFMLSDFSPETGATLVIPGSHRRRFNPPGTDEIDSYGSQAEAIQISGCAGSVLVMDSRCWHAAAPNPSDLPRVAFAIRFAPWWLNLEVLRPGSFLRRTMVESRGKPDGAVPALPREVFATLPETVKPLFHHWIERDTASLVED